MGLPTGVSLDDRGPLAVITTEDDYLPNSKVPAGFKRSYDSTDGTVYTGTNGDRLIIQHVPKVAAPTPTRKTHAFVKPNRHERRKEEAKQRRSKRRV